MLRPGDLVCITRHSIGVRLNSIGLIIEKRGARSAGDRIEIYTVQLVGCKSRTRAYLARDLKRIGRKRRKDND